MTRAARAFLLGVLALGLWTFADLYLRIDLPGAGRLQHLAFRAATDALQWLDVDRSRIRPVAMGVGVFVALAAALGQKGVVLQRIVAVAFCAPVVVAVVVSGLMERAIFAGWVVGTGVLHARGLLFGDPRGRSSLVTGLIGVGLGAGALVTLFLVVSADSSGYSLPARLRVLERSGGLGGREIFLIGVCVVAVVTAGLGFRRASDRSAAGFALLMAGLAALIGSSGGTRLTTVVAAVAVVGLTKTLGPLILGPAAEHPWETRRWPGAMLLPALVAAVLFAHTYTARLFHCPDVLPPYLVRMADPAEVFSTALSRDGNVVALSLRAERRLGRIRESYGPGPHRLEAVAPGPIPAPPPEEGGLPGTTYATVEELVAAPEIDAFFATVLAGHTDFYSLPTSPPNTVNNMVVRVRGDGAAVDDAFSEGHLCWIGTLSWDAAARRLYLGCEYEPTLHRLDFDRKTIDLVGTDARLGDVAGVAVDPERDRLYTVSLWDSDRVTELDRSTLQVLRSRRIGGTHYGLAYDLDRGRLFAPAFYASRIRIVDVDDLSVIGTIPTGLGPRALSFVPGETPLLLAAAVYDDLLRICDGTTGALRKTIRVGGHVKSIAVDPDRRLAYFWSRCGLFRLDIDAALKR
jgi:hypothetical protein